MKRLYILTLIFIATLLVGIILFALIKFGSDKFENTIEKLTISIGFQPKELSQVELASQIPGYELDINNPKELLDILRTFGTFLPDNGLDPIEGTSFTINKIRIILTSTPLPVKKPSFSEYLEIYDSSAKLISNSSYQPNLQEGIMEFHIYIDPVWLKNPQPTQKAYPADPGLAKMHLFNWQFIQLVYSTSNKNVSEEMDLETAYQKLHNQLNETIAGWESYGFSNYPISL